MKRQCGDCQLCCKLLPVNALGKLAGQKCKFQKFHKGCTVHHTVQMPNACRLWHCRWLINDDAADLPRPDRAHYVIDILPDEIALNNDETGERVPLVAIQIWADPDHRDGWRNCKYLRAWIVRKAAEGFPTLVRYSSREAIGVFAPPVSQDGEWHFADSIINKDMGLWK